MARDVIRVGLIVPSSNTVMEPDFHQLLGTGAVVSTTRIFLEDVTREDELKMIEDDLPRALKLIETTAPHVVVFGCTSAGSLGGLDHDARIGKMLEMETGARAVTVVASVVAQLRTIRPSRIAVFTPYLEDLTASVTSCVSEAGYAVVHTAGMGLIENRAIGRVRPDEIADFVETGMEGVSADCVFLSCTNWQAVRAIATLQRRLGIPVISSNQATAHAVTSLFESGIIA